MHSLLALVCILTGGTDDLPPWKKDIPKFQGKWERVAAKDDPSAEKIDLEFYFKAAPGEKKLCLLIHLAWTENGEPKKTSFDRYIHFAPTADNKDIWLKLSKSSNSAEIAPFVQYRWNGDRLELTSVASSLIRPFADLTGTYQRVPPKEGAEKRKP
jgi:hypothetical protein